MNMCERAWEDQKINQIFTGAVASGVCEPLHMGAGISRPVLMIEQQGLLRAKPFPRPSLQ